MPPLLLKFATDLWFCCQPAGGAGWADAVGCLRAWTTPGLRSVNAFSCCVEICASTCWQTNATSSLL